MSRATCVLSSCIVLSYLACSPSWSALVISLLDLIWFDGLPFLSFIPFVSFLSLSVSLSLSLFLSLSHRHRDLPSTIVIYHHHTVLTSPYEQSSTRRPMCPNRVAESEHICLSTSFNLFYAFRRKRRWGPECDFCHFMFLSVLGGRRLCFMNLETPSLSPNCPLRISWLLIKGWMGNVILNVAIKDVGGGF